VKYKACAVVDIDGVLADYISGIFRFIKERTGVEIPPLEGEMEFYSHVGKFIGHERAYELKHIFRDTGVESQGLEPIPGSRKFLTSLKDLDCYILLMTARPYKKYRRMMADTIGWLKQFGFPYHAILFDENKEDRIIRDYSFAKFVVEDTLSNAKKIAQKGIRVLLRDQPYNQGDTGDLPIERFKEYDDILFSRLFIGGSHDRAHSEPH
jgi:hypothetical protein